MIRVLLFAALLVGAALPAARPAAAEAADDAVLLPGDLIVERVRPAPSEADTALLDSLYARQEELVAADPATGADPDVELREPAPAGPVACYQQDVPEAVRGAVDRALLAWADGVAFDAASTVEVDVFWSDFGPGNAGVLGAAGPSRQVVDDRLPDPTVRYPVALANRLLGGDLTPRARCDLAAAEAGEVLLFLNATAGAEGFWYPGADGRPAPGQYDLQTVALHELAHGLGFTSSAGVGASGLEFPRPDPVEPGPARLRAYDRQLGRCTEETAAGCGAPLVPVGPGDLAALTGGDLWFDLGLARPVELNAPPVWQSGSSVTHLDDLRYPTGTVGSLMTPNLDRGEVHHVVDGATLGVLQALAWPLARVPGPVPAPTVVEGDGTLRIRPQAPSVTDGPPPTVIEIEVTDAGGSLLRTLRTEGGEVEVSGLVNGAEHRITATGYNAAGAGPTSAVRVAMPAAYPPFATAAAVVRQVHRDLLGTSIDPGTERAWVALLEGGGSVADVLDLANRAPAAQRQLGVVLLYLGLLDRLPDEAGARYWSRVVADGTPVAAVASSFLASDEFQQRFGGIDDGAFVDLVYRQVLGRPAEPAGRAYWTSRLGRDLTRAELLVRLTGSPESRSAIGPEADVVHAYLALLDRLPDEEGFVYWVRQRRDGVLPRGLLAAIAASDEYAARVERR